MRTLIILLFCTIISNEVIGKCAGAAFWVFPENGPLKQNSLIILTGYGWSQTVLDSLNERYPVYLESEGHKVKLNLRSRHRGMFRLTQAVLEPDEKLIADHVYQLVIENLDDYRSSLLTKWDPEQKKKKPFTWTVKGGTDIKPPTFIGQPEYLRSRVTYYGCGPAVYADFSIGSEDDSAVLLKTEIQNLESNRSVTYYLNYLRSDTVQLGHGMCSGPFKYEHHTMYRVRFSLMDICGNESSSWTDWVEFRSPFDEE